MKKSKIIPLQTEPEQLIDHQTVEKITEGLDSLEGIAIETPSQIWFEQFILEQKRREKEKWRKELFLYTVVVIFILSGILFSLYRMPIIFIILQGLGISLAFIFSMIANSKQVKHYEQ